MLLDNGRTAALADPVGRQALHCIRCSACLNVCPVYERTGGHAYGSVYPGPIGAVLSPQLTGVEDNASLPYASSLCGACYDACPVQIDIPSLLVHLRARHVEEAAGAPAPVPEAVAMAAASWVMASPARYAAAQRGRAGRPAARPAAAGSARLPPPLSAWTAARDAPVPPAQTFREWWRDEHEERSAVSGAGRRCSAGSGPRSAATAPAARPDSCRTADTGRTARPARRTARPARRAAGRLPGRGPPGPPDEVLPSGQRGAGRARARAGSVVPAGPRRVPGWPATVDAGHVDDGRCPPGTLDAFDGVITTAAVAIAETGTIVLDGRPGQGRRALSLVPDYHLCVVARQPGRRDRPGGRRPAATRTAR